MNEFDKNRYKWNKRVVKLIYDLVVAYPTLRIAQIMNSTPSPYEEPEATYRRLCDVYQTGGENDYDEVPGTPEV